MRIIVCSMSLFLQGEKMGGKVFKFFGKLRNYPCILALIFGEAVFYRTVGLPPCFPTSICT